MMLEATLIEGITFKKVFEGFKGLIKDVVFQCKSIFWCTYYKLDFKIIKMTRLNILLIKF